MQLKIIKSDDRINLVANVTDSREAQCNKMRTCKRGAAVELVGYVTHQTPAFP